MKVLLWSLIAAIAVQGVAQTNSGVVTGRVTGPDGAEGIAEVQLLLVGPLTGAAANAATGNPLMIEEIAEGAGIPRATLITGPDGQFVFRNLAPGQYTVRARREGYFGATPSPGGGLVTLVTAPLTVGAGGAASDVQLRMLRGAIISGRVRNASGQTVPNAPVTAYEIAYREGREVLSPVSTKTSDDRGEYRLFWLPPGNYYVGASATTGTANPAVSLRLQGLQGLTGAPRESSPRTFYPGVTEARAAVPFAVAAGAEVSGADIDLKTAPTFTVSGRFDNTLTAANGSPGATPSVLYLVATDPNRLTDNATASFANQSAIQGTFEIRGVPPGSYDLIATAPDAAGRAFPGRVRIEVADRNVEGVTLPIHPGVEVKARVLLDGKPVTPGVGPAPRVQQLRSRELYAAPFDAAASAGITMDSSGVWVFPDVPEGTYSVVPALVPANAYVADIREGGVSVYDNGLVVGTGAPGMIDVMLSSGAQSIRGVVRTADGKPAVSANVVVVPPPSRRRNAFLYRTLRTNFNGEFQLSNVPPGDYKLFAWESVASGAYLNAAFIGKYESRGRAVTVAAGANLTFDLTLIPIETGR